MNKPQVHVGPFDGSDSSHPVPADEREAEMVAFGERLGRRPMTEEEERRILAYLAPDVLDRHIEHIRSLGAFDSPDPDEAA